ncbi:MAG: hypothetical protein ACR2NP_15660 [Pirellulaceae bacterium]
MLRRFLLPTTVTGKLLACFVLLCLLICSTAYGQQKESLPSADDVLEAFYESLGGEMAIAGMSEIRFKGTFGGPASGNLEVKYKDGKFAFEYDLEGFGRLRQGFDGTSWWRSMPDQQIEVLEGEDKAMASQLSFCTPQFLDWRDFDGTIEVVEAADFRGTDVWHLTFTDEVGAAVNRFFDQESGLLVASNLKTKQADSTTLYEFEEFEGVLWASRIISETRIDGVDEMYSTEILFTEYDFDAELDDDELAMPGKDSDN